ncbi:hypothetical protein CLV98_104298 [Dyadobacter jejuensis]|uniref:Uncharacterized protein n=1 Tax=Dyadobacter jejuensis TaxID=1082580 RepID=A0A316ALY9_9BACT|nr:hypothetical protein [Dyadobacter jejuensis]PWJ58438.1 hypothetical protein CLV98_104298 [Dyadobacter jejuensis]
MKVKLLAFALLASLSCKAQKFFVAPTEKGFESKIIDKMKYKGYQLVDQKQDADYLIECLVDGQYKAVKFGSMFKGFVKISDRKTGQELARTKEVGKSPSVYNGFQAGPKIMAVIAEKYLIKTIDSAITK